jgi:YD repeat-containing protein
LSNEGKGVDSIAYVSETQVDVTAAGKLRSYTIAAAGERMRVVAMSGPSNAPYSRTNAVGWTYDAQTHLLSEVTFGGGTINRFQDFDSRGNPRTVILAYGRPEQRTITYAYHPVLNTPMSRTEASVLGSGSKVTIWDYDEPTDENYNQNPTSLVRRVIETGSTLDQAGNVVSCKYTTTFGYNTKGQLTAYSPPASKAPYAILSYDSPTSNLLSITQAMIGKTELPSYDQAGYPLRMIDPNGEATDYGYDGGARLTRITHSDGSSRSMIYDMGVLRTQIDEDGVSQTYDYDSSGRRSRITDQENNHIGYEYDSLGNITSMKYLSAEEVLTRWKRWSYQHPSYPGLLWKEILADPYDGTSTIYEYNSAGKVETVTDFNGNTTSYAYDGFNRVTSITQPGGVVTGYGYDGHGNLETLTDGEQHQTVYTMMIWEEWSGCSHRMREQPPMSTIQPAT